MITNKDNNSNNSNEMINDNNSSKAFGYRIQALRRYANLKVTELARIIGVPHSTISRWESGVNYPTIETLILIAKYFNVSIDYLLGLSKCSKPFTTESESYFGSFDTVDISNLTEDEKMLVKSLVKVLKK